MDITKDEINEEFKDENIVFSNSARTVVDDEVDDDAVVADADIVDETGVPVIPEEVEVDDELDGDKMDIPDIDDSAETW